MKITMKAYGEEGHMRVARHQKLREGKGFRTIECPERIEQVLSAIRDPQNATVLLECVSNLVANEMFDSPLGTDHLTFRVTEGIRKIAGRVKNTVIVTVNIFEGGSRYDNETREYIRLLGEVNRKLAEYSDEVTEVVVGIPVKIK